MKHTPGPWKVMTTPKKCDTGRMRVLVGYSQLLTSYVFGDSPEEANANAKLIAAAPELLEALTAIVELGRKDTSNPKYDGYYSDAKAAIKKATE